MVATKNRGKFREIEACLEGLGFKLLSLHDLPEELQLVEDEETFRANALKKAREVACRTGKLTVADDSGLEVEALGGLPGVRSARFAGEGASDEENNRKLLEMLRGVPLEQRRAAFRCVMAVVDPETGSERVVEGSCRGIILERPRGRGGFGYDPLFFVPERGKTMAELPLEEKNLISHRGQALKALKGVLRELAGRGAAG